MCWLPVVVSSSFLILRIYVHLATEIWKNFQGVSNVVDKSKDKIVKWVWSYGGISCKWEQKSSTWNGNLRLSTDSRFCLQFVEITSLAKYEPGVWDVNEPKCKSGGASLAHSKKKELIANNRRLWTMASWASMTTRCFM